MKVLGALLSIVSSFGPFISEMAGPLRAMREQEIGGGGSLHVAFGTDKVDAQVGDQEARE
jgi:hypothetical protein